MQPTAPSEILSPTTLAPEIVPDGQVNHKRVRTRADRLRKYSELLARANGLDIMLADPAGYLHYVMETGRDPLEQLIDRKDGKHSPFQGILDRVAVQMAADQEMGRPAAETPDPAVPTLPNTTKPPTMVDKQGRIIFEALEDKLKERGWVPLKTRLAIAKVLMPYEHNRLAQVEDKSPEGKPRDWANAAKSAEKTGPSIRGMMESLAQRASDEMAKQSNAQSLKE